MSARTVHKTRNEICWRFIVCELVGQFHFDGGHPPQQGQYFFRGPSSPAEPIFFFGAILPSTGLVRTGFPRPVFDDPGFPSWGANISFGGHPPQHGPCSRRLSSAGFLSSQVFALRSKKEARLDLRDIQLSTNLNIRRPQITSHVGTYLWRLNTSATRFGVEPL